jgi:hypothetical protein
MIFQSLARKLFYKSTTNLTGKRKPNPQARPTLDSPPARSAHAQPNHVRRPTTPSPRANTAQAGKIAGTLANTRKSPRANCYWYDQDFHYFHRQTLCKNTLLLSCLYIGAIPDAPPHTGVALPGTGRLRPPAGSFYHVPKGERLTSMQTRSTRQRYRSQRRSDVAPSQRWPTDKDGAGVPVT